MAMMTIMANNVGEITPSSNPMFSTTSSIRPRVFIKIPRLAASRQDIPEQRSCQRAAELSQRSNCDDHRAKQPIGSIRQQAQLGVQARVGEESRQQ